MALPENVASEKEKPVLTEIPQTPEIPPEDIEHVEAVAKGEVYLPTPVTDDKTNQVILDNAAPQQVTVTLPLTDEEMNHALHLKIIYAARWLAEWCKRLIKIMGGKFFYKSKS